MVKTMQQQDHDAWEEGYGGRYNTAESNELELENMRAALRRRKEAEEKKAAEEASDKE